MYLIGEAQSDTCTLCFPVCRGLGRRQRARAAVSEVLFVLHHTRASSAHVPEPLETRRILPRLFLGSALANWHVQNCSASRSRGITLFRQDDEAIAVTEPDTAVLSCPETNVHFAPPAPPPSFAPSFFIFVYSCLRVVQAI